MSKEKPKAKRKLAARFVGRGVIATTQVYGVDDFQFAIAMTKAEAKREKKRCPRMTIYKLVPVELK